MSRTRVPLETALGQLLVETRLHQEKVAAAPVVKPEPDPITEDLRKVAALLRDCVDPSVITYDDLNRVKEAFYGRR